MVIASLLERSSCSRRPSDPYSSKKITEQTREAVAGGLITRSCSREDVLLPSRCITQCTLVDRQYARIVDGWVQEIGLDPAGYGTHTLRRTKGVADLPANEEPQGVQLLLGHTKTESTVRYLGIEVDDALEMAEQTKCSDWRQGDRLSRRSLPAQ